MDNQAEGKILARCAFVYTRPRVCTDKCIDLHAYTFLCTVYLFDPVGFRKEREFPSQKLGGVVVDRDGVRDHEQGT